MDGRADDLVARKATQPAHSLVEEGRKQAGAHSACLRPHLAQSSEDRLEMAREELGTVAAETVVVLSEAMTIPEERMAAREALADYYWDRFLEAEANQDFSAHKYFGALVAAYHNGKYRRELTGDGFLSLGTDPPGAEITLYRYEQVGFVLEAKHEKELGTTPLGPVPIAMGSYLAVIRKEGYREMSDIL